MVEIIPPVVLVEDQVRSEDWLRVMEEGLAFKVQVGAGGLSLLVLRGGVGCPELVEWVLQTFWTAALVRGPTTPHPVVDSSPEQICR